MDSNDGNALHCRVLDPMSKGANDSDISSENKPRDSDGPFGRRNPDPGSHFRQVVTDELKSGLVEVFKKSYRIVQDCHDESLGFDAHTFGYNVYRIAGFQIQEYCRRTNAPLQRADELKSIYRFRDGDYTLAFYKVGRSADENIWECFPSSENGANPMTDEAYPMLKGIETSMLDDIAQLRYAVIAHLGNSADGLCAVYLCIPVNVEDGKIKRWGYAECIYRRQAGVATAPPPRLALPPAVDHVPPVVPYRSSIPAEEPEGDVIVTPKSGR